MTSMDFHAKNSLMVTVCDDELDQRGLRPAEARKAQSVAIRVYNLAEGKHERTCFNSKHGVSCARFTHHPRSIVYASSKEWSNESWHREVDNNTIWHHSLTDNAMVRMFKRGHTDSVLDIEVSKVDDLFFSCSKDKTVKLWDLRLQEAQHTLEIKRLGLDNCREPRMVLDRNLYQGGQSRLVWVGGEGGHIVCFDPRTFKAIENHEIEPQPIAINASMIMPHQHYRAAIQAAIPCDESPIKCLKVGNDGNLLAFSLQSYQGAVIYVYDTDPLHYKKDFTRPKYAFATREQGGEFDFSPDDKYLLSAGPRGSVIVWNLENGRTVAELPSARWNISCLKWLPTHQLFATGGQTNKGVAGASLWVPTFLPNLQEDLRNGH